MLAGKHDWHAKTVGTFLTRLVQKGLLTVRREGRTNVYHPCQTRAEGVQAESASFLERIFQGCSGPLLLHFAEQAELSPEEIQQLERLLRQKKKGQS